MTKVIEMYVPTRFQKKGEVDSATAAGKNHRVLFARKSVCIGRTTLYPEFRFPQVK